MSEEQVKIEIPGDRRAMSGGNSGNEDTHENAHENALENELDAHPQGLQLILLTMSLMFAVFIMALDTTILCMCD